MPPVGFEPIISAGERPQTHALDRPATVTGSWAFGLIIFFFGGELNVRLIPTKGCGSRFMVVSIVIRLRDGLSGVRIPAEEGLISYNALLYTGVRLAS